MQRENNGVLMINFWSSVINCGKDYETNTYLDDVAGKYNDDLEFLTLELFTSERKQSGLTEI